MPRPSEQLEDFNRKNHVGISLKPRILGGLKPFVEIINDSGGIDRDRLAQAEVRIDYLSACHVAGCYVGFRGERHHKIASSRISKIGLGPGQDYALDFPLWQTTSSYLACESPRLTRFD